MKRRFNPDTAINKADPRILGTEDLEITVPFQTELRKAKTFGQANKIANKYKQDEFKWKGKRIATWNKSQPEYEIGLENKYAILPEATVTAPMTMQGFKAAVGRTHHKGIKRFEGSNANYIRPKTFNEEAQTNKVVEGTKRFAGSMLNAADLPRRVVAGAIQGYTPNEVVDLQRSDLPLVGREYAAAHPNISAAVDIATPFLAVNALNVANKAAMWASRGPSSFTKVRRFSGLEDPRGEMEVVSKNAFRESSKSGGKKLTGSYNGSNGRPLSKGSTVNKSAVNGQYAKGQINKDYELIPNYEPMPTPGIIPWAGVPNHVNSKHITPSERIEHGQNKQFTLDEIINNTGAQVGDTIQMPNGELIKYTLGGSGNGKQRDFNINKTYDKNDAEVGKQFNVPARTKIRSGKGSQGAVVKTPQAPSELFRNRFDVFPYRL